MRITVLDAHKAHPFTLEQDIIFVAKLHSDEPLVTIYSSMQQRMSDHTHCDYVTVSQLEMCASTIQQAFSTSNPTVSSIVCRISDEKLLWYVRAQVGSQ